GFVHLNVCDVTYRMGMAQRGKLREVDVSEAVIGDSLVAPVVKQDSWQHCGNSRRPTSTWGEPFACQVYSSLHRSFYLLPGAAYASGHFSVHVVRPVTTIGEGGASGDGFA